MAASTCAALVAAAKYASTAAGSKVACSSSSSSGCDHGTSCGVRLISTGPASLRTAASTSRVTVADRPVGRERDALDAAVAVLDDRLVACEVERDDDHARSVGRRQRLRLEATRA